MVLRQLVILLLALTTFQLSGQGFTNYTTTDGLANNTVNCVAVDSDDNVWFGTDAGISFFNQEDETWVTLNVAQGTGLVDDRITAIYMSPFSGLWVGTDFGISNWDGATFTSYTEADGIGDDRVRWITEGKNGELFFANKEGFSIFDGSDWQVFGSDEGLPFGGATSISIIDGDIVVLGLGLEGVALFDIIDTTIQTFGTTDGLLSNKVKSVLFYESPTGIDNEDAIWVASDNGMNRIHSDHNDEPVIESHPSVFELPPPHEVNQLTDVKVDSEGIVWAGVWIEYLSNVGGISFYNGDTWTTLDVDDGLVGPVVYQLAIDSHDCVWVATSTGVSKYCTPPSKISETVESNFQFYPNPSEGSITVELTELSRVDKPIYILNTQMQILFSDKLAQGIQSHMLVLDQLITGVYFLRVGDELQKFVKL